MSGEDRLTHAQRACLLRAARRQLEGITSALDRLLVMPSTDADITALGDEIKCMQAAIRWLWKNQRADDG